MNDPDIFLRRLLATDGATPGTATNVAFFRSPLVDGMLVTREPARVPAASASGIYQRLQSAARGRAPVQSPCTSGSSGWWRGPACGGSSLDPGGLHHLERMGLEPPAAPAPPRQLPASDRRSG